MNQTLAEILEQQLGRAVSMDAPSGKTLADTLGCTSLEIVSLQIALEEPFGMRFAEGPAQHTAIDEAWDKLVSVADLDAFVAKWRTHSA